MNDGIKVGRVMSEFVRTRWNGKESVAMILANLGWLLGIDIMPCIIVTSFANNAP